MLLGDTSGGLFEVQNIYAVASLSLEIQSCLRSLTTTKSSKCRVVGKLRLVFTIHYSRQPFDAKDFSERSRSGSLTNVIDAFVPLASPAGQNLLFTAARLVRGH